MSNGTRRGPRRTLRSRRTRSAAVASAVVAATVMGISSIWLSSYAAFTGTTTNTGNSWHAGTVTLADDDSNTAMFSLASIAPGQSGSKCIAVTYNGTLAASVKLYAGSYSSTNSLGANLTLTITQGTGGGFSSCTGFTADTGGTGNAYATGIADTFGAKTTFAAGVGSWAPTGASQSKTYKIDWALPAATTAGQNGDVTIGFTWEAQNT